MEPSSFVKDSWSQLRVCILPVLFYARARGRDMARASLFVYTNCELGKEDEFNRWYDDVHVPDMLSIDGIVSAQRFELFHIHRGPHIATEFSEVPRYLVV